MNSRKKVKNKNKNTKKNFGGMSGFEISQQMQHSPHIFRDLLYSEEITATFRGDNKNIERDYSVGLGPFAKKTDNHNDPEITGQKIERYVTVSEVEKNGLFNKKVGGILLNGYKKDTKFELLSDILDRCYMGGTFPWKEFENNLKNMKDEEWKNYFKDVLSKTNVLTTREVENIFFRPNQLALKLRKMHKDLNKEKEEERKKNELEREEAGREAKLEYEKEIAERIKRERAMKDAQKAEQRLKEMKYDQEKAEEKQYDDIKNKIELEENNKKKAIAEMEAAALEEQKAKNKKERKVQEEKEAKEAEDKIYAEQNEIIARVAEEAALEKANVAEKTIIERRKKEMEKEKIKQDEERVKKQKQIDIDREINREKANLEFIEEKQKLGLENEEAIAEAQNKVKDAEAKMKDYVDRAQERLEAIEKHKEVLVEERKAVDKMIEADKQRIDLESKLSQDNDANEKARLTEELYKVNEEEKVRLEELKLKKLKATEENNKIKFENEIKRKRELMEANKETVENNEDKIAFEEQLRQLEADEKAYEGVMKVRLEQFKAQAKAEAAEIDLIKKKKLLEISEKMDEIKITEAEVEIKKQRLEKEKIAQDQIRKKNADELEAELNLQQQEFEFRQQEEKYNRLKDTADSKAEMKDLENKMEQEKKQLETARAVRDEARKEEKEIAQQKQDLEKKRNAAEIDAIRQESKDAVEDAKQKLELETKKLEDQEKAANDKRSAEMKAFEQEQEEKLKQDLLEQRKTESEKEGKEADAMSNINKQRIEAENERKRIEQALKLKIEADNRSIKQQEAALAAEEKAKAAQEKANMNTRAQMIATMKARKDLQKKKGEIPQSDITMSDDMKNIIEDIHLNKDVVINGIGESYRQHRFSKLYAPKETDKTRKDVEKYLELITLIMRDGKKMTTKVSGGKKSKRKYKTMRRAYRKRNRTRRRIRGGDFPDVGKAQEISDKIFNNCKVTVKDEKGEPFYVFESLNEKGDDIGAIVEMLKQTNEKDEEDKKIGISFFEIKIDGEEKEY